MVNIYVGNLSYTLTEDELRAAFEQYGAVEHVTLIVDRATGKARGFGFVEMPDADAARNAIAGLHDFDLKGRKLMVNEARPKEDRPRRRDSYPRPE